MPDAHLDPKVHARVPADDLTAGRQALNRHGWTVQEAVIALLRAARADQEGTTAFLEPHRPERKRPGRPRRERP